MNQDLKHLAKHLLHQQEAKLGMSDQTAQQVAQGQSAPHGSLAHKLLNTPILGPGHHPQVYDAFLKHIKGMKL